MGPDDAVQAFKELKARQMVPMHYGTFKLSFEDLQDPPHRLDEIARALGCREKIRILEEGSPEVF
jgi:L-ascorbate metabolism protein UlaG (beta-lactamase superfamily)